MHARSFLNPFAGGRCCMQVNTLAVYLLYTCMQGIKDMANTVTDGHAIKVSCSTFYKNTSLSMLLVLAVPLTFAAT